MEKRSCNPRRSGALCPANSIVRNSRQYKDVDCINIDDKKQYILNKIKSIGKKYRVINSLDDLKKYL